jgi:hypothetical protein
VILISAICAAVALPLYYYRHRVLGWFGGKGARSPDRGR